MIWRESENGNFVILSCLRKGPFGVDALNQMLRERYEREKKDAALGIPILITRTDEELGLCNGETGLLFEDGAVFSSAPHKKIPRGLLPPYEYAFCLSVHKSQGSEYEQVLLIIPPGSENFGREVVYTGATRAKKRLKIVSDLTILQKVLERGSRKISALHERVR
jgi:exodeoxyribonuclease V alpha subunit